MATQVSVVLQKDVDNLGVGGDVVRVRPGYARNYLIPRGLALPATKGNLSRVEALKAAALARATEVLEAAKQLKGKLEKVSVKIERAVGDDNKMYGSVTTKDIEEAYSAVGIEIDRKKISLGEPIKQLGLSEVKIRLHREVDAALRVEVVKSA
jgi:large subunit ribosomal protein L9